MLSMSIDITLYLAPNTWYSQIIVLLPCEIKKSRVRPVFVECSEVRSAGVEH